MSPYCGLLMLHVVSTSFGASSKIILLLFLISESECLAADYWQICGT